jgi:hypothetical protein
VKKNLAHIKLTGPLTQPRAELVFLGVVPVRLEGH